MSINQIQHDDASSLSSGDRFKIIHNGGVAPWSDPNHDVLLLVMMQLGFVEFFAFSGVCKSWRSLALFNRSMFMASKPPMSVCMSWKDNWNGCYHLEDFERRKFKPILPHFAGRLCVGSTCGYMVFFCRETRGFLLVNPITRHELHFPDFPSNVDLGFDRIRTILVFSPSISEWVFVILYKKEIFYTVGKRRWNHVSSTAPILDLHVFKGKIYTLDAYRSLGELRLNLKQKPKWTLLKTKNFLRLDLLLKPEFVSSDEKLYLMDQISEPEKVLELDFGEMKWVSPEKTVGEYAFFISMLNPSAAIKPESWAVLQTPYKSYNYSLDNEGSRHCVFIYKRMWYFLHDCSNVNLLDE